MTKSSHKTGTKTIPVAGPWITDLEVGYVTDAAANAWYENAGDYVRRFETSFAALVGRRYAVSLPSCTSALHLALLAAGVGPGDEVIVPDATWIASAAPITYIGAVPVFCDIDPRNWCLSVDDAASRVTPRTRAILPVDLYGGMPDMGALAVLADRHGLVLIEDAAEAIGSKFNNCPAGSFGKASAFSFHGSKTVTTGEGGMLVTDDADLLSRVRKLQDHGRPPGDVSFINDEVAYKYKMSALQAAMGLGQVERISELVGRKRQIFSWYREALEGVNSLTLNPEPPRTYNSYWMTTVLWPARLGVDKLDLMARLQARGVSTRPFFSPLSGIPAYRDAGDSRRARAENLVAYDICSRGLNLPSALSLTKDEVGRACKALCEDMEALAGKDWSG